MGFGLDLSVSDSTLLRERKKSYDFLFVSGFISRGFIRGDRRIVDAGGSGVSFDFSESDRSVV